MAEQLRYGNDGDSLFIPGDTLKAMRDSRYRNTAYALAELIDNSIDAKAKHVDIICYEEQEPVQVRVRWRLQQIAVLDDGHGMTRETLVQALRFGGRQVGGIRRIGKYGMGLPTASVSTSRRVDVWTWQTDIANPWHSYIDVDSIEQNAVDSVPAPDHQPIPDWYIEHSTDPGFYKKQGTLIVWSNLDRVTEKSETIFNRIEREIGKIYRHFIDDGDVIIYASSFREGMILPENQRTIRVNDPLYLMSESSTPVPWSSDPMFEPYGDIVLYRWKNHDGQEVPIEVKYSIVKQGALINTGYANPGSSPHGQHARRNLGVSVVRERREVLLEDTFVRAGGASTNPMNRWWGCEISFNSGADDLFGIDHNKQMAAHFTQIAKEIMNSDESDLNIMEELADDDETLYKMVVDIRNTRRNMLAEIERKLSKRRPASSGAVVKKVVEQAEIIAAEATKEAIQQGKDQKSQTDEVRDTMPAKEREEQLAEAYYNEGHSKEDAQELARKLVQDNQWYWFDYDQLDGYQMFRVRNQGGVLRVILNINHPLHDFIGMFEEQAKADLSDPVRKAGLGLILLLISWARMEDQTESSEMRRNVQNISMEWGKHVEEFIRHLSELQ